MDSKTKNEIKKGLLVELVNQHGVSNFKIAWLRDTEKDFTYRNGEKGWMCNCLVTADGFKPATLKVVYDWYDHSWKATKQ